MDTLNPVVATYLKAVVAIYETHGDAEAAIRALQKAGCDMQTVSIVGRDFLGEGQVLGGDNTGKRMRPWGTLPAFWGGMWGLLMGRAFFFTPDRCAVLVAGPLVDVITTARKGAVVGAGTSAVGAGLCSLGIPRNIVLDYELALRADRFLLVAHGSGEEVAAAKDILTTAVAPPAGSSRPWEQRPASRP